MQGTYLNSMHTQLGMVMGRVFSDTRLVPSLMGWGSILINGFGMGLENFFKTQGGFEYCPVPPRLYIKLNFKINLI